MQNLTWLQKLANFFSLIKYNKKDYSLYFFQAIIRWFNPVIHVIFIQKIVFALSQKNSELLQTTIFYYIIAIISFELLWLLTRKFWWIITIAKSEESIYEMYLKKFVQMDNNSVEKIWVWKIIAILENWRHRWCEWLANVIEKWTSLLILLVYVCIIIIWHGFLYTLAFFMLLIISITLLFFVNKYQFKYRNKRSELRNDRLRLITKVLMSKNEILQTNRIDNEINKIQRFCNEMSKINVEMSNWRTVQNRLIPFTIWFLLFLFIFFYAKTVLTWSLSISQFVWITSIFLVINSSVQNFIWFYIDLTKDFIDIEKMWDFFENTPSLVWYDTGKNFEYKNGNIEIKNMTYSYYEWKNVFENFWLNIVGWKITALVWNSWSWKTTLMKLISGYIKANSWEIIIDKQKLSDISLKSFYHNIWYLSQEPSVFDGTVLENLTYALPSPLAPLPRVEGNRNGQNKNPIIPLPLGEARWGQEKKK